MKSALALSVVLLVAACQVTAPAGHSPAQPAPAVTDDARIRALAAADFNRAIPIRVELRDQGFTPEVVRLAVGQPYRLTVQNIGGFNHYLNAPEFLRSIAVRHVEVRGEVEIEAAYFSRFEVARRGGQFSMDFVPLVRGEYRAYCHLEGNSHRGVEGRFVVE